MRAYLIVLFAPAIIGLLTDACLSAGFGDRDAPVGVDLGSPELIDDLFRNEEPFLAIYSPFLSF